MTPKREEAKSLILVAGGQADVGGAEGGAEGVGGGVDPALGEVEAERFGDFAVEGLLGFDRERARGGS